MPKITLSNIAKHYGTTQVITDFNATVEDGEFLVLLGPSGCGKSTLLRMIAGLSEVSRGTVAFDGTPVNDWTPGERGIAFVFQSYALYPHMSVRANIAFPLVMDNFRGWHHLPLVNGMMRRHLMRRPDIAEKTERMARQLELTAYLDRRPANLSGGQRQRVALARALVRDPQLYLLDEPLSNLDAKLRAQMRSEISALHQRVGKTFIYVTHDQIEAMTMATKIIVMDKGRIQQIGTPDDIYERPANTFVARFVGAPPMNLLPVAAEGARLSLPGGQSWNHDGAAPQGRVILGMRPEDLRPVEATDPAARLHGEVVLVEKLGPETVIGCRLGPDDVQSLGEGDLFFVRVQGNPGIARGDTLALAYAPDRARWFDPDTGDAIAPN
ncbi:ABC transporter ATP-binding protein [Celeribacter indicus]|uniref:ABC transporter, nucleotide binding/ATPase protein n=1 Tax=Celeribacter indicus TaxID=1208324 RepID=A0A0B5E8N8_9RHOB|nr:ATP-binding cassette domain-containing protein [Celeribacter indicus]AJE48662.1 ABC transporter, nucleotide binding/ATPase protein [Celeribacter indicus]SDX35179.1 carbohydrate ABC transporter ATP-binding protein, CUT1 family [Celeribacter indicus]